MAYKYAFTVFTTTYKRAHTIHRVYNSLEARTFQGFEWVVIDTWQGDNTKEFVK